MAATRSSSPFFRLPSHVRQRIYIYLLAPHAKETVTTINYSLRWPWFENPSNTTFNGAVQIDLCRCPQNLPRPRTSNSKTEDHIYSRSKCYGPDVRFHHGSEDLWVCGDEYPNSGQINFPRPGVRYQAGYEAVVGILATCQAVYEEAVGVLYRNRNFLFLSGPCPRGRFQAYATRVFLSRLSPFARANVTSLSIISLLYEEDANINDAEDSYHDLAGYIQLCLPSFQTLCVNLWNEKMGTAAKSFGRVFEKSGVEILLSLRDTRDAPIRCKDKVIFEKAIRTLPQEKAIPVQSEKKPRPSSKKSKTLRRSPKQATLPKVVPRWEEVEDEAEVGEVITTKAADVLRRMDHNLPRAGSQDTMKEETTAPKSLKLNEEKSEEESDEDWFDAPSSANAEEWEIVPRETKGDANPVSPTTR